MRWASFLSRLERRWFKLLISVLTIWLIVSLYSQELLPFVSKKHRVTEEDIKLDNPFDPLGFIPIEEARSYCADHNWKPYRHRHARRKIYDLIMVNTELDWLEIRMNELHKHVDFFVVLESATTFTGLPKSLAVKENWEHFKKFESQIIHHIVDNSLINSSLSWDHEKHQRNAMFSQVVPKQIGPRAAHEGDIILVSDVDEIPRPASLTLLRNCDFPRRLTLRSRFYYYSFQWLHRGQEWAHPQATTYQGVRDTILPHDLRSGKRHKLSLPGKGADEADLWNAAWHCSSCFSTINELLTKMRSFSHTELNKESYRGRKWIVEHIRSGKDLWDRFGQWYTRVDNNADVPRYLADNREKFAYMLDRDGPNAGFIDLDLDDI